MKAPTLKASRKKADAAFSRYIRLRDADPRGWATCVTCGKKQPWTRMDAGHFISRSKTCTRYDPRNCHAQCKRCNMHQGGHFLEHERAIVSKYGSEVLQEIKELAAMRCTMSARDYLNTAEHFRSLAP